MNRRQKQNLLRHAKDASQAFLIVLTLIAAMAVESLITAIF